MNRTNDGRPVEGAASQRGHAERMADSFESPIVRTAVKESILNDGRLARLADSAARIRAAQDEVSDMVEDDRAIGSLEAAAGRVTWLAEQRVYEVVAEACADVLTGEFDVKGANLYSGAMIEEARVEARVQLETNTNAATRAGVMGALDGSK